MKTFVVTYSLRKPESSFLVCGSECSVNKARVVVVASDIISARRYVHSLRDCFGILTIEEKR